MNLRTPVCEAKALAFAPRYTTPDYLMMNLKYKIVERAIANNTNNAFGVSSSYFTATLVDDTALLAVGGNESDVSDWTKRWKVMLNDSKSEHVDFTKK